MESNKASLDFNSMTTDVDYVIRRLKAEGMKLIRQCTHIVYELPLHLVRDRNRRRWQVSCTPSDINACRQQLRELNKIMKDLPAFLGCSVRKGTPIMLPSTTRPNTMMGEQLNKALENPEKPKQTPVTPAPLPNVSVHQVRASVPVPILDIPAAKSVQPPPPVVEGKGDRKPKTTLQEIKQQVEILVPCDNTQVSYRNLLLAKLERAVVFEARVQKKLDEVSALLERAGALEKEAQEEKSLLLSGQGDIEQEAKLLFGYEKRQSFLDLDTVFFSPKPAEPKPQVKAKKTRRSPVSTQKIQDAVLMRMRSKPHDEWNTKELRKKIREYGRSTTDADPELKRLTAGRLWPALDALIKSGEIIKLSEPNYRGRYKLVNPPQQPEAVQYSPSPCSQPKLAMASAAN